MSLKPKSITFRKSPDNSWIQCFICGKTSHNKNDSVRNYCGSCHVFHDNGIVESPTEADRQQKIIVALFLVLGKAVNQLNAGQRKACAVRESEIREAWTNKHSPVRIVSETRMREAWQVAEAWGPMEERVFNVEMNDMDIMATGMKFDKTMPEEPVAKPKKQRVFELE